MTAAELADRWRERPFERLPLVRQAAADHGVSIRTVRRARGLLLRDQLELRRRSHA